MDQRTEVVDSFSIFSLVFDLQNVKVGNLELFTVFLHFLTLKPHNSERNKNFKKLSTTFYYQPILNIH